MGSQSSLNDISNAIRQEIIRFESVHPNIYAIYDLIDAVDDKNIAESLRQLVGLLGSVQSGKSALVHRYLTGAYVHDESPEGGRFKKELSLDNQSHLLLIRDEGGPPDLQFSQWIDGVIFVFSLENVESYQTVYDYYARLSTYRNTNNLPMMLVGTQACLKILQLRTSSNSPVPRPLTPQLSSNSQQRPCANSPVEGAPLVGISQSQQSLFSNAVNAREGPTIGTNCNVVNNCITSGLDKKERTIFSPHNPANRRPDTHSTPGFELDFNEDSGLHQTLVNSAKPNLLSLAKHSLTLDFRPYEREHFFGGGGDVKPVRPSITSVDSSADDWATHPFLFDGKYQHPLLRCPEYIPTEYSESVFQSYPPHMYSEYSGSGKALYHPPTPSLSSVANSENGSVIRVCTPQSFSAPTHFTVGHSPPPLPPSISPNFPSGALAAASSVSSFGLGVEGGVAAENNKAENNESLTPSSTPTHSRKNRRKSNLFVWTQRFPAVLGRSACSSVWCLKAPDVSHSSFYFCEEHLARVKSPNKTYLAEAMNACKVS
ncbi:unnamed protein product [Trichobilharzia regenti]|nr:unnamed protein product [Trichobilharzia regenti]